MTVFESNFFQFWITYNVFEIFDKTDEFKVKTKKRQVWTHIFENSPTYGNFENGSPLPNLTSNFETHMIVGDNFLVSNI